MGGRGHASVPHMHARMDARPPRRWCAHAEPSEVAYRLAYFDLQEHMTWQAKLGKGYGSFAFRQAATKVVLNVYESVCVLTTAPSR